MKRTNIMLTNEQHKTLKKFAKKESRSLGELVREAVDVSYGQDSIEHRRSVAIESYKEGFLSIGKLSEILGVDTVEARDYLKKKSIHAKSQRREEILQDVKNA